MVGADKPDERAPATIRSVPGTGVFAPPALVGPVIRGKDMQMVSRMPSFF